jgi:rhodanese-related sulfurtransferase
MTDTFPLHLSEAEYAALPAETRAHPLVDVRRTEEFAQGHLAGALFAEVTAPDFDEQIRALNLDPNAPVFLYCRSGNRSGVAASILRDKGYAQAVNVGGYEDLVAEGLTPAAEPAAHPALSAHGQIPRAEG